MCVCVCVCVCAHIAAGELFINFSYISERAGGRKREEDGSRGCVHRGMLEKGNEYFGRGAFRRDERPHAAVCEDDDNGMREANRLLVLTNINVVINVNKLSLVNSFS